MAHFLRLGVFDSADGTDEVHFFGPLFTDDDSDTIREIIDGFNAEMEAEPDAWNIAVFPAEISLVPQLRANVGT